MIKVIPIAISILLLTGCATSNRVRIANETQIVKVPLLYCPAPPITARPNLPIHRIGVQTGSEGELVKAYVATVKDLQGYILELEAIVESYDDTNEAYDELRKKFDLQWVEESMNTDTTP